MKAERRHELKTNTLAQGLEGLPEFWRKYGTKVLLGVVAVLALVLFFRVQQSNTIAAREAAGEAYSAAINGISNLKSLPLMLRDPKAIADQAGQLQTTIETAIAQVLDNSDDEALKAEALVARGDLNWYLARMPGMHDDSAAPGGTQPTTAGSATRPAAVVSTEANELLEKAQRAYTAAAQTAGAKPMTVATARLGLAAIAEQRRQWDEARKAYEQVRDDPSTPAPFKAQAELRLDDLKEIQQPVLIGQPTTAPSPEDVSEVELPSATAPVGPPVPTTATTTTRPATTTAATAPAASR